MSQRGWSKNRFNLSVPLTESNPKSCQGFKTLSVKCFSIWHTTCSPRLGTETIARIKKCFHWPVGEAQLRGLESVLFEDALLPLLLREPGEVSYFLWLFSNGNFEILIKKLPSSSPFTSLANLFFLFCCKTGMFFHPKLWSEQNYPPKEPQRWRFFTLGKPRNIISERAFYEDILHGTLSAGFLITAFCIV